METRTMEAGRTGMETAHPEPTRPMAMETSRTTLEASRPMEGSRTMATGRPGNGSTRRTDQPRRPVEVDTTYQSEAETRRDATSLGWLWVLPLAALAGLGWYFLRPTERTPDLASREVIQPARDTARDTATALPDLKGPITNAIQSLTTTFQGITDRATASTALPKLQDAAREMDRLAAQSVQLPTEARRSLANATREPMTKLNTMLDSASALPGVGPLLQPTVASLRSRMDGIAMIPGKPLFLAGAPGEWTLLSSVYNKDVQNKAGERMGTATGFFVGPDGKLVASLVSVDRQLGIGDKQIGLSFANGQFVRKDDGWHFVIDTTKDEMQRARTFETGK
jgi:hypothetical protein